MLEKGDHIIYIQPHAKENGTYSDNEIGFVTSVDGETAYCRFFYPNGNLRTKANSEACWTKYIKKISNVKMFIKEE